MQSAKDTFYAMLRDRVAAGNAGRTVVIRGVSRPGVLVEENELVSAAVPTDVFVLHWVGLAADANGPLPLVMMECNIQYETAGSAGTGGMDRGRLLAEMDAELINALVAEPQRVVKMNFAVEPPTAMGTMVFWSEPIPAAALTTAGRMGRTAKVQVWSYQEAGEQ